MDDDVPRRLVLRTVGAATGGSLLNGVAAAGRGTATGEETVPGPVARAREAASGAPRHLLPGSTGTADASLPTFERCFYPNDGKELYGPTRINATTGNQGLSVGVAGDGTVTVLRWPRPSFYDQIKHYATDRSKPRMGAAPNEGSFLGVRVGTPDGERTHWLRDWATDQRYARDDADAVVTEHRSDGLGLTVTVRDVVARDDDALLREATVDRDDDSPVESVRLLGFANVNPVVTKVTRVPVSDWCLEEANGGVARYDPAADAIVHERAGVDDASGEPRSVAVAVGFDRTSAGHQVGGDAYERAASPLGRRGPFRDAYDDASDGRLGGNDRYVGQSTAALSADVDPDGGAATFLVTAGESAAAATETLGGYRERDPAAVRAEKRAWYEELFGDAPLPDCDDGAVVALAKRALVSLAQAYDPDTGTIVASIATQSPYGEDWPRDGAYFNYLLDALGLHDWVASHNRFYARVQQGSPDAYPDPAIPPGNWAMNYYADGVPGGPIPWEIDETGYGAWTLWDHYAVTGDDDYLEAVYPAIRRAADYLVACRDPETGLHCTSWEDDVPQPKQTIVGAAAVWLGLDAAAKAASERGEDGNAATYEARRDELAAAIDEHLWAAEPGAYGPAKAGFTMSEVAWPVGFRPSVGDSYDDPLDHPRIRSHMDADWAELATTFAEPAAGNRDTGLYESKGLVPLAKARRASGPGSLDQVRDGVRWVANRHATDDTHVMGEVWTVEESGNGDREVVSIVSQPHVWEQCLCYMAALEAFPPEDLDVDPEDSDGVLEALRERNAPDDAPPGPPDETPGNGDPPQPRG